MFWIVTQSLLSGLATTFEIFILTLIFALPLGLILAFGLLSKFTPLKRLVQILVWIIRGTPLMLQLIIIFYGPGLWLHKTVWSGNETGRITATVVAFVINYACYFSVIFRGGIDTVTIHHLQKNISNMMRLFSAVESRVYRQGRERPDRYSA